MRLIQNNLARAEQFLNPLDWIPVASSFSGTVRIMAGTVQIAASLVFAYIKVVYNLLNRGRVFTALKEAFVYTLHGAVNILRGAVALQPGLNLLLLIHDWKLGRLNYPSEIMRPGVYPLATAYRRAQLENYG